MVAHFVSPFPSNLFVNLKGERRYNTSRNAYLRPHTEPRDYHFENYCFSEFSQKLRGKECRTCVTSGKDGAARRLHRCAAEELLKLARTNLKFLEPFHQRAESCSCPWTGDEASVSGLRRLAPRRPTRLTLHCVHPLTSCSRSYVMSLFPLYTTPRWTDSFLSYLVTPLVMHHVLAVCTSGASPDSEHISDVYDKTHLLLCCLGIVATRTARYYDPYFASFTDYLQSQCPTEALPFLPA